tara:strand:+ start:389 stop:754 length:366 start_codon:yes stop_codon:yes gene_type:complete
MIKSNPFSKAYFKEQSKKYVSIAKKSFRRLQRENDAMYLDDGTLSDKYNDQTMCNFSDMEKFLEFIDDKESFYSCDSCIVDLIKLDNEIEKNESIILKAIEKVNKAKNKRKHILSNDLKVE